MNALKISNLYPDQLMSLRNEVFKNSDLFDIHTFRQDVEGTPHKDTKSIYLRMCPVIDEDSIFNDTYAVDRIEYDDFPSVKDIVRTLMYLTWGEQLGRIMIVSLKGGGKIEPHMDEGEYPEFYTRYHIPIVSESCDFIVAGEVFNLKEGEIWAIDNEMDHEVINHSFKDRIHLIVDIR